MYMRRLRGNIVMMGGVEVFDILCTEARWSYVVVLICRGSAVPGNRLVD